jgi:hypothetical protein
MKRRVNLEEEKAKGEGEHLKCACTTHSSVLQEKFLVFSEVAARRVAGWGDRFT